MGGDGIWSALLWGLFCVILVTGLAYWFTRYVVGRQGAVFGAAKSSSRLNVLAQLALGREQRLLLVQAGERYFLLGCTPAGITSLAEFSREEAAAWAAEPTTETGASMSFGQALQKVLEEKRRR